MCVYIYIYIYIYIVQVCQISSNCVRYGEIIVIRIHSVIYETRFSRSKTVTILLQNNVKCYFYHIIKWII